MPPSKRSGAKRKPRKRAQAPSRSPAGGKAQFDQGTGVRRIARERLGAPPPVRSIQPKDLRKKPKHKKSPGIDELED